jgi:UDP-N-acetylmuramyl pentapeptide synthase
MSEAKVVCADDSQAALVRLLEIVGAGDCVLCKASRQIGLDRLVDNLISHLGAPSTST